MTQVVIQTEFGQGKSTRWTIWLLFLFFALLFHALIFSLHFPWTTPSPHVPIEIQNVDPKKLEAVKRQWREKGLLLDKNKSKPSADTPPEDARYFSDKNIRVEKEQRAKDTNVVPAPGRPNSSGKKESNQTKPEKKANKPKSRLSPKIGSLGIPLPSPGKPGEFRSSDAVASETAPSEAAEGGDQAISDKNLPVGSENLLNAQESVYYSFYSRLYEAIGPIWQSHIRGIPYRSRISPGEYSTVVDVVLDENGKLIEVRTLQSSGIPDFDTAVTASWNKIGRFPNPPAGLLDKSNRVHTAWTFTVQVGEGFNFRYLPPERNS